MALRIVWGRGNGNFIAEDRERGYSAEMTPADLHLLMNDVHEKLSAHHIMRCAEERLKEAAPPP